MYRHSVIKPKSDYDYYISSFRLLLCTVLFDAYDTSLLYFSGHGFINEIGGYIVTPDYKENDEGVSMDEILSIANNSKSKNKIIILDCCYSGALGQWDQRPVFKTNITQFTSLRDVNPQVTSEILRKIIEYFPTPEQQFNLDPSFEDTNSEVVKHKVVKPYAKTENVVIFKNLQKLQSIGLIVPVDEDYMYFAAMNSKSCKLTALGYHYWRLVKEKRI